MRPAMNLISNLGVSMNKRELSPLRQHLLEEMQNLNFGRIEKLAIRDREPVFSPPPRIVCEVKPGGESGPRPEIHLGDFQLKPEMIELFEHMDLIGHGEIDLIEVRHGLVFRLFYEKRLQS
jgi:hypothetical protein